MNKEPKDCWDKLQLAGAISIPIVLAITGYFISSTLKNQELKVEYVSIAVDVLKAQPTPETKSLRDWATRVLNEYSPIELSEEAVGELTAQPLPSGYVEPGYVKPGYIK